MIKPSNHQSTLPGADDITRAVLPNGIVVLARENFNSPSVTISGHIETGSIFEPDEKLGLADFVSAMLMRGSQTHSSHELYDQIEAVGASLGFNAGVQRTSRHFDF